MIKKQQKVIALAVVLAFLSWLQISSQPLHAASAPSQSETTLANAEQAPRFIEEEGESSYQPKKKSVLPIILGVVAVGAVAAVLVLVVFKTKYDIVGTWDFAYISTSPAHTWTWSLLFTGDKKSGTFVDEFNDKGTYTMDNKNVSIKYNDWKINMTGKFDSKDKMSGTATFTDMTIGHKDITSATWTATRVGTTAAVSKPQIAKEKKTRK